MSLVQKIFSDSRPDEFDRKYGVQTAGLIPKWKLLLSSVNAVHGIHYQPVGEHELCAAIEFIDEDFSQFTFIDLGCGKGRAIVIAERYNFRSVIGIEYNRSLSDIARRNVRRSTVIHADAADFRFPDEHLILFLYNPFSSRVMSRVVDNLASHRRKLYVLYCNPQCAELFGDLTPLGEIPGAKNFLAWKRSAADAQQSSRLASRFPATS